MIRLSRIKRLSAHAMAVALVIAVVTIAPAAEAHAAGAEASVLISTDGVHFSSPPSNPVFTGGRTLVPGTTQAANLYVRNTTSGDIVLTVYVTNIATSDPAFSQALTVQATTAVQGSTTVVSLASRDDCPLLLGDARISAGQTEHVSLALAMADVSGATAAGATANFNLRLSMRGAAAPAPAAGCAGGTTIPAFADPSAASNAAGTARGLATTGIEARLPLAGGALLFGLGSTAVLFAALRRGRRGDR